MLSKELTRRRSWLAGSGVLAVGFTFWLTWNFWFDDSFSTDKGLSVNLLHLCVLAFDKYLFTGLTNGAVITTALSVQWKEFGLREPLQMV